MGATAAATRSEYNEDGGGAAVGGLLSPSLSYMTTMPPFVDDIAIDPRTRVVEIAASADGLSRRHCDSPFLHDVRNVNDAPAGYVR